MYNHYITQHNRMEQDMKRLIAAAAAIILTAGLTACSGNGNVSVASTESGSEVTAAGIKLDLPEDWTASVGNKAYEAILGSGSDSGSSVTAEELRKSCEENGMSYLVYAVNSDKTAVLTLTSITVTADETGDHLSAEDYARSNHDTAIFSYQASGMYIRGSGFGEKQIADKNGYLSHFEVCSDEETAQLIMGQSEFTFEQDGKYYSLQTYYHNEEAAADAEAILAGISVK